MLLEINMSHIIRYQNKHIRQRRISSMVELWLADCENPGSSPTNLFLFRFTFFFNIRKMLNMWYHNLTSRHNSGFLRQWFPKWVPRPPGGPRAECRGSAIAQPNIGGPWTFQEKYSLYLKCMTND